MKKVINLFVNQLSNVIFLERHFGTGTFYNPVGEEAMKKEIYLNGPIATAIEFHQELSTFHSDPDRADHKGIYHVGFWRKNF